MFFVRTPDDQEEDHRMASVKPELLHPLTPRDKVRSERGRKWHSVDKTKEIKTVHRKRHSTTR